MRDDTAGLLTMSPAISPKMLHCRNPAEGCEARPFGDFPAIFGGTLRRVLSIDNSD
jgi:hypothetical protein